MAIKMIRARHIFYLEMARGLKIVWPVIIGPLLILFLLGFVVGRLEGWNFVDSFYFTCITGLTIGYGDLVPGSPLTRLLTIGIGINGVILMGIITSVAVSALQKTIANHHRTPDNPS